MIRRGARSTSENSTSNSFHLLSLGAAVVSQPVVTLRPCRRKEIALGDKIAAAEPGKDRRPRAGFTLVEMLVVMGIIGLVAALILPATSTILRGSQLTQATQLVTGQLSLARQVALSKNHSVEVRFYQFGEASAGEQPTQPSSGKYRAMQLFEITDAGTTPLGKIQRWPVTIMIDAGATLSSIIAPAAGSAAPLVTPSSGSTTTLPGIGAYNTVSFRFLPDGSTNLSPPSGPWFLTLHNQSDLAQPPNNFSTIQIDAFNGYLRTFRP